MGIYEILHGSWVTKQNYFGHLKHSENLQACSKTAKCATSNNLANSCLSRWIPLSSMQEFLKRCEVNSSDFKNYLVYTVTKVKSCLCPNQMFAENIFMSFHVMLKTKKFESSNQNGWGHLAVCSDFSSYWSRKRQFHLWLSGWLQDQAGQEITEKWVGERICHSIFSTISQVKHPTTPTSKMGSSKYL